jgi:hypothetical protein
MDKVIRFAARPPAEHGVTALCAQLRRVEGAESPDEATMDAIADAERRLLAALAGARSDTLAEVAQKLAALARRADAADGFLCGAGLALLHSALGDLRHFDRVTAVA